METEHNKNRAPWWQPGLVLFTRLSGWIAGPVILGVIVGKWLDQKYHTEPWLFLITVGVAFIFSMFGIVRDSLREMKRIEKEEDGKDGNKKIKFQISNNKSQINSKDQNSNFKTRV